ncbi:MAG: dTMP kinase [Calditrichaeota bacterium]|nr:dTMP kinase [Calditrichota bacterium]
MFISFEGLDCSGKSTQIRLLCDYLNKKGQSFQVFREPGDTEISEKIRSILLDAKHTQMADETELLLYLAARAQLVAEKIEKQRVKSLIIADRFIDSTVVYQGYGRGLNIELIQQLNNLATRGIKPEKTILLDITAAESYRRRHGRNETDDRIESSGLEFFERVRKAYLDLAVQESRFIVIDAEQDPDLIHQEIITHLAF